VQAAISGGITGDDEMKRRGVGGGRVESGIRRDPRLRSWEIWGSRRDVASGAAKRAGQLAATINVPQCGLLHPSPGQRSRAYLVRAGSKAGFFCQCPPTRRRSMPEPFGCDVARLQVLVAEGRRGTGRVLGDEGETGNRVLEKTGQRPGSQPGSLPPPEAWSETARVAAPSDSLDKTGMAASPGRGMASGFLVPSLSAPPGPPQLVPWTVKD